ncbi:hypothetical protein GCL60_02200 [Silvanigrella paludirubra]|uniref:YbaK/aminoacyl-tRNA synthetase-associated domain-containing protein n=1 Tax=Silvanigrella paludirubra TaxID=2499159 RepID=A0A6N6VWS5_9BACT|nr:YbaK/EbsC family protein [Silvanigrella paludirubra]KAB8040761.1 hypothetical protein GCL60_02200 [Silvanigrella paludirubra]
MLVSDNLISYLNQSFAKYSLLDHKPTLTSEESLSVRIEAGYKNIVGAKALLLELLQKDIELRERVLCILPGSSKLNEKKLVEAIGYGKKLKFLDKETMLRDYNLVPGSVPPFGNPIIIVKHFIIDSDIFQAPLLGFNAGLLTRSIIIEPQEYKKVLKNYTIASIANRDI